MSLTCWLNLHGKRGDIGAHNIVIYGQVLLKKKKMRFQADVKSFQMILLDASVPLPTETWRRYGRLKPNLCLHSGFEEYNRIRKKIGRDWTVKSISFDDKAWMVFIPLFGSESRGPFISIAATCKSRRPSIFLPPLEMEYDSKGPILKILLLIGGNSSATGSPKELLQHPDSQLAFEHTLNTLHSAVPSASTIYISLQDITQLANIEPILKDIAVRRATDAEHREHGDHRPTFPECCPMINQQDEDIGPAGGLFNAHSIHPESTWLVLSCGYPLLPPSALQQLILEYQCPVTCFVNEKGIAEPLIGIWGAEALEKLKENRRSGSINLHAVVEEMRGKLVKPLREEWITPTNTRGE
jgi:molybdopterin-guanine dinucleotide biosynthesis protein A